MTHQDNDDLEEPLINDTGSIESTNAKRSSMVPDLQDPESVLASPSWTKRLRKRAKQLTKILWNRAKQITKKLRKFLETMRDRFKASIIVWMLGGIIAFIASYATIRECVEEGPAKSSDVAKIEGSVYSVREQLNQLKLGIAELQREQSQIAKKLGEDDPQLRDDVEEFNHADSLEAQKDALAEMEKKAGNNPALRALQDTFNREMKLRIYLPKDVGTESSAAVREWIESELTTVGLSPAEFDLSWPEAHLPTPCIVYSCDWAVSGKLVDMTSIEKLAVDVLVEAIREAYKRLGSDVEVRLRSATNAECDDMAFPPGLTVFLE